MKERLFPNNTVQTQRVEPGTGRSNRKYERQNPQRFGVQKGPGRYSGRFQVVAVRA